MIQVYLSYLPAHKGEGLVYFPDNILVLSCGRWYINNKVPK